MERLMTDRERLLVMAADMLEFARGDLERAGETELAQSLAVIQTRTEDLVHCRVVPAP
jgi:hypothetical protein